MADVDIDSFGEHESRPEEPTDEHISLHPVTPVGGRSTWEQEGGEQETSFGGVELTQKQKLTDTYVDSLYKELSNHYSRTSDATHYDNFECKGKRLYFIGRDEPLTTKNRKLRSIKELKKI